MIEGESKMSEGLVGLYNEPEGNQAGEYIQMADGKWYPKCVAHDKGIELAAHEMHKDMTRQDHYEAMSEDDAMPVGDVNSDEKGTGARALGADKVPMQWVPVRFWLREFMKHAHELQQDMHPEEVGHLLSCVQALGEFTEGRCTGQEMVTQLGMPLMESAAKVFDYGANKYKAWNWLKGMPWSIPVGCALRHMKAVFVDRELLDSESGLPHVGHFACNIIMLATYDIMYVEGNDLPPEELWDV